MLEEYLDGRLGVKESFALVHFERRAVEVALCWLVLLLPVLWHAPVVLDEACQMLPKCTSTKIVNNY